MSSVNAAWSAAGAVSITLALVYGMAWSLQRRSVAYLLFSLTALAAAGNAFSELSLMLAGSIEAYGMAMKQEVFFAGLLLIGLTWFVHVYFGTTRRWVALAITGSWIALLVVNHLSPSGLVYREIVSLHADSLWGERIVHATGNANPWNLPANVLPLAIIAFVIDGALRLGRSDHRKRAMVIGGAIVLFLVLAGLHSALVDHGIVAGPYLVSFFYLAIILAMSYELGTDIIRSSRLAEEVEANERRWRSLLENVKLLAVGVDREGRIDYVNPHFSEVSGYAASEIIGKPIPEIVPESEREDILQRYRRALAGEIPTYHERVLRKKDGSKRQITWSNVLLRDPQGRATGTLSLGADITERRQAEQELQRERAQMTSILSSMNTGLALINPDFTVDWVNQTLRDLLPWGDPVGRRCFSFAENRETPCEGCQAEQAFADGRIHERDLFNAVGNRWFNVVAIPIRDEHGKVVQVLESNTDITDRKRAEEELTRALEEIRILKDRLEGENIYLREELQEEGAFREIVGKSNAIHYVLSRIKDVAGTDSMVLVQGETGVGKELIARAIHESSRRAGHAFIKINCAALPPTLIESDLFGHERGAFTGADRQRTGRFELAHEGTLMLDEIGELPLDLQVKLLHVLEDGTFQRVGGTRMITADVRVIAVTNRNLQDEIAAGRFRADLFYRLNVFPLTVPPLRGRREDIPLLVNHFVLQISGRMGKKVDQVPQDVMERLVAYDWPGNVRELRNVLERAVITSEGSVLRPREGFLSDTPPPPTPAHKPGGLVPFETMERDYILQVLESTGWRISGPNGAAKILEMNPSTLRSRISKLGIKKRT